MRRVTSEPVDRQPIARIADSVAFEQGVRARAVERLARAKQG